MVANGLCSPHYQRVKLTGDLRPNDPIGYRPSKATGVRPYKCSCGAHDGSESWHGKRHGFSYHGCRCERCTQANRQRDKDRWEFRYASKYGLSVTQIRELLSDPSCAICGTTDPGNRPWHIDHDHECCQSQRSCGKCVRGVLCFMCNFAIGSARDDVGILAAAIDYLTRWRDAKAAGHDGETVVA